MSYQQLHKLKSRKGLKIRKMNSHFCSKVCQILAQLDLYTMFHILQCKNNGTTALHYAIKENEMGISRQIIATGRANLNKQNWGGNTPLIIACR